MKHFTISEMLKSDTALKNRFWNGAPKEAEDNLRNLIEDVLDPLRERLGKPIYVTSGYRCPKLNNLVNGAPNSQHMRGEAADITALDPADNVLLGRWIEESGKFDQLIYESVTDGIPRWLHVSYRRLGWNRRQVMKN